MGNAIYIAIIAFVLAIICLITNIISELKIAIDNTYQYNCSQAGGKVVKPAKYVKDCVDADGKSIKL